MPLQLIACLDCDLLQREPPTPKPGAVHCGRCGGVLYRNVPRSLERTLALSIAAALCLTLATLFPLLSLEIGGRTVTTSVFGMARVLTADRQPLLAALVLVTLVVMPALEIFAILYMVLPLKLGIVPRHLPAMLRLLCTVRPWGMVEVFILGALVTIGKIVQLGDVVPGVAIWSSAALMVLLAMMDSTFEGRPLWACVRELKL
jgi:paraquat-inducible protein A